MRYCLTKYLPFAAFGLSIYCSLTLFAQQTDEAVTRDSGPGFEFERWLNQIEEGSLAERLEAARNPPEDASRAEIIPPLADAADGVWLDVRIAAIHSLGQFGDSTTVPFLRTSLSATSPQVREATIWALADIGDPSAAGDIQPLLHDVDSKVRIAAAWFFAQAVDVGGRRPLLESLADEINEVRIAAVWGLAPDQAADTRTVLRGMLRDENYKVRVATAQALAKAGDLDSTAELFHGLGEADPQVRQAMAEALAELQDPGGEVALRFFRGEALQWPDIQSGMRHYAVPFLISLLSSDDSDVRQNAAKALGQSESTDAVPALERLAESRQFSDRVAAAAALADVHDRSVIGKVIRVAWASAMSGKGIVVILATLLTGFFLWPKRRREPESSYAVSIKPAKNESDANIPRGYTKIDQSGQEVDSTPEIEDDPRGSDDESENTFEGRRNS